LSTADASSSAFGASTGGNDDGKQLKQHLLQQLQQTSLQVFVEDTSKFTIGTQTSNPRWIRAIKGEKGLQEIGHSAIGENLY
jgi:hypothetical protein